jgi:hypothetical protein
MSNEAPWTIIFSAFLMYVGLSIAVVGFFPCFGWLNWIVLMYMGVQILFAGGNMLYHKSRGSGWDRPFRNHVIAGVIIFIISGIRLVMGGGIL